MSTELVVSPAPQKTLNPEYLPSSPLYATETGGIGWALAAQPFQLSSKLADQIRLLGPVLWRWQVACDGLYRQSLKGSAPSWVATLLSQGKPEALLKFGQMNRFKNAFPLVIRPDLLLTEEDDFVLTEVDSVPGGIGFTAALNQAYEASGFSVQQSLESGSLPMAFLKMLKSQVSNNPNPVMAIVLSDEAGDYRLEMEWLVTQIQTAYPDLYLVHPKAVALVRDQLMVMTPEGEKPLDLIYRFFELFDLPNIPQMELIQYAVKKGLVVCTPPFKPWLEEKLWMGLLHHPVLVNYWTQSLGEADFVWLKSKVPETWILDSAPIPPQSVIPNLTVNGQGVSSWQALMNLSQKERQKVIKPSGFSPLAWGSRGVTIGHDGPVEAWNQALTDALANFETSPHILQVYHKPALITVSQLNLADHTQQPYAGRVRLCPYFFNQGVAGVGAPGASDTLEWVGTLATLCPADKKIIHGMKDAIMAPCTLS